MPKGLVEQLRERLKAVPWQPRTVETALRPKQPEPPRYVIRAKVLWLVSFFGGGLAIVLALLDNPLAKVQDLRLGTRYDNKPLTSLAADSHGQALWLGSLGGGIKIFDPRSHFFRSDVTHDSSGGKLLSDFVADLDIGSNSPALGVIVTTDGTDGPGGLQIAEASLKPKFWDKPIVDLSRFPGLTDSNATAIAASADKRYLVFGTRGFGLGVYQTETHSWQPGITSGQGLPSDNITDLVAADGPAGEEVIWVATDRGLCAGPLDHNGQLAVRWKWGTKDGLAGEQISRLHLHGGFVWYLTHGGGLGRVALDASGAPRGQGAHELLVSERQLRGLGDEQINLAFGSPVGPTTWFTASVGQSNFIGRYSEMPCDTYGVPMPAELASAKINSVSADAASGNALLLGSSHGAWFYSGSTKPVLEDITGGAAGLENENVVEVALGGIRSTARLQAGEIPWLATVASNTSSLPWIWTKLVGPGRFAGLTSLSDITCIAGESNRVHFGTKGKGIGMWDLDGMEVTQTMSSHSSEPQNRLRNDTSLDLASVEDALIQVTGDHAVDVFREGRDRLDLVPTNGPSFSPGDIAAVASQGRYFAAAAKSAVWYYDQTTFRWAGLPNLAEIKQIEFAGDFLWALTSGGQLSRIALSGDNPTWQSMMANVRNMAVAGDTVYALTESADTMVNTLLMFSAGATEAKTIVGAGALPPGEPNWQYAAALGDDLYLLGSGRTLQHYSLARRKWDSVPLPEDLHAPFKQAVRSASTWNLLDSSGSLYCFQFANGKFSPELEEGVEKLDALNSGVLALRGSSSGTNLLVLRGDEDGSARVLVGLPFQGDLGKLSDATEWNGDLVVAEGSKIGFYDWLTHSWSRHLSSPSPIRRFYSTGSSLWAELGDAGGLQQVAGDGLHPVELPNEAAPLQQISPAMGGLYVMDHRGRVLFVPDTAPTKAEVRLAASTLAGTASVSRNNWALLDDAPAVATGSQIQVFRSNSGPPVWKPVDLGSEIKLLAGGAEHKLFAATASGLSEVHVDGDGILFSQPIDLRSANGNTSVEVKSLAVTSGESLVAAQASSESGLRVWSVDAALKTTPVVGPPLTNSDTTRAVVELPNSEGLIRLETGGRSAEYTLSDHSWNAVIGPNMDELFRLGETVFGFSRKEGLLCNLTGNDWSQVPTGGQLTNVQAFPNGILLWRTDGRLGLCTASGTQFWSWSPQQPANPVFDLGEIKDVAEVSDNIILLSAGGRLAAYDWNAQHWLPSNIQDARQLVKQGRRLYVLRGTQDSQTLAGPVATDGGALSADPVQSTSPVRAATVVGDDLFALCQDGNIKRLTQGQLEPWWGQSRANGQQQRAFGNNALAAARLRNSVWVVLQQDENTYNLLKLDEQSLTSELHPLPPGKIERLFEIANQRLYAEQAMPGGKRILDIVTGQPVTPLATNATDFGYEDGKFKAVTSESVLILNGDKWEVLTNKPLEAAALDRFKSTLITATNLFAPDPAGAWQDCRQSSQRLALLVGPPGKNWRLIPALDGRGLADEQVNDIIGDGGVLLAATDGGIVEFEPNSAGMVSGLQVPTGSGISGRVLAFTNAGKLLARTAENNWLERDANEWKQGDPPSATAFLSAQVQRANAHMDDWRWVQGHEFKRKTRSGEFRDTRLVPGGFDFEFVESAEVGSEGELLLHTAAGSLFYRAGSVSASPDDLLLQQAMPSEIKGGFVLKLPDGSRWLSSSQEPGLAADGPLWAGSPDGWQPATSPQRQALKAYASAPFLDSSAWEWGRPGNQTDEQVTYKFSSGKVRTVFSRTSGRFGWDICYDVGQAKDTPWLLTEAGLFRVHDGHVDLSSQKTAPVPASQLRFAKTSAPMPGGLVRADNPESLVGVYDTSWQTASDASPALVASVKDFCALGRQWQLRRDGSILRSVPESPGTFHAVRIMDTGRWNFETVSGLAAFKDWCHLATPAGMVGLQNESSFAGWWPDKGQASAVGVPGQLPVADAGGRRIEFNNGQWTDSTYRGSLVPPLVTNDLAHFRVVHQSDGGATLALKLANGDTRELSPHGSRFPFDEVRSAALIGDGQPLIVTGLGSFEIGNGGDLTLGAAMGSGQNHDVEFFRVSQNPDQWTLYARIADKTDRWVEGWQPLGSEEQATVDKLQHERLAYSATWRVDTNPSGGLAFRLHTQEDSNGHYRLTPFDAEHGRFGFDALISVAGNGDALYLGSKAGLERLGENGGLKRLWCQEQDGGQILDGIGPDPVEQLAFGESKILQMRVNAKYFQLETADSPATASARDRYMAAVCLRHDDPNGWRVIHSREEGQALQMWWSGQPVFLITADDGISRFAHNVVYAAAEVNGHLALGTAGGLLILDAINTTPGESSHLLSAPFQLPSATNDAPSPLIWLQAQDERTLLAASAKGKAWRVSEGDAEVIGEITASELADAREKATAADDLLQWRHPDAGKVAILYSPDKIFPAEMKPEIQNGTFTFADLRTDGSGTSGTVQATAWGLFWLTRAGVMHINTESGRIMDLQQTAADQKATLSELTELRLVPTSTALYAQGRNAVFRFDALNGRWNQAQAGDNPFQDQQMVNSSPMLEWRQDAGRVRIKMKSSDQPAMLVFHQGKPSVDRVHEIAFATESGEDHLLMATDGGVVVRQADSFEFRQRFAAAFSPDNASAPVDAVISVADGNNWRQGARTSVGHLFERTVGGWNENEAMKDVFEAGYLRVQDPSRWTWARYPTGLNCKVQKVNGPALNLGSAMDATNPPAFSRGKISLDDIRAALLVDSTVLAATPVGIVRYNLSPQGQRADFAGLDVWAKETATGAAKPVMLGLRGMARDHGLQIWSDQSVFANLQNNQWTFSTVQLRSLQTERKLDGSGNIWRSAIEASRPDELRVDYRGTISGSSWFVPISGTNIIGSVLSEGDLWVLTSGGLYQASEKKLRESIWEFTGLARNHNLRD